MTYIFSLVAIFLNLIAKATRSTYNEINIVVYYFIIPFTWLILIDNIFQFHYFKIGFVIFCLGFFFACKDFKKFSDWLFDKSVSFLNYFNRIGSNYIFSSVVICVVLPIFVYTILIWLNMR